MPEIARPQLAVYAAAALVIVLVGARYLRSTPNAARPVAAATADGVRVQPASGAGGWAVVQVAGAVRSPGVYRLRAGRRVDDAVRMAGGPTARADLSGVNLAAKAEDGRQVIVPERLAGAGVSQGAAATSGPGAATGAATAAGAAGAVPVNLNTATAEQLDTLDGVGPATARKILAYRQVHGGFGSVSELGRVPGIGDKKLAALREQVTV